MSLLDTVIAVARSVLQDALAGQPPAQLVEPLARTNIERARAELRLGDQGGGDSLLRSTIQRLEDWVHLDSSPDARPQPSQLRLELLRAVALSVSGQGLERRGLSVEASARFGRAVEIFARIPEDQLIPRDHSDYGVALAALGRDAEARVHLEQARENEGNTPEAARHLARLLLDNGETSAAERLLNETLQVAPNDADAFALLGRIQALRHHPAAAMTYQQAAYLLLQSGRAADAGRILDAARDLVGDDRAMVGLRAEALRLEGRHEDAVKEFSRALQVTPDNPWLLGRRGAALAAIGHTGEARLDLSLATELAPEDVSILLLAGEVALGQNDIAAARMYCDRALAVDPRQPATYALRARLEQIHGTVDAGLDAVRAGRALAPQDPDLLRLHADLEHLVGNTRAAVELLQRLCALPNATPQDHWKYADLLAATGRVEDAVNGAADALRRWPDNVDLIQLHGDLLRRSGSHDESEQVLLHAAELDPRSARTRLLLALSLVEDADDREGAYDEALEVMAQSANLAPTWADPYYVRAQLFAASGRLKEALSEINAALARDPNHSGALELRAKVLLDSGDALAAEKVARRLLEQARNEPKYLLLLARALVEQDRSTKALKVLADVPVSPEEHPEQWAQWLLLRGQALRQVHRWEDAESDLSLLVQLRPDFIDGWIQRAELARMRGAAHQALEYANRALALEPDNVKVQCLSAAALMDLGRTVKAQKILEEALRREPDYVFGLVTMAQLMTANKPEQSQDLLERAITIQPANRMLRLERGWIDIAAGNYDEALRRFDELLNDQFDADALAGRAEALRLLGQLQAAIAAAEQALELRSNDARAMHSLGLALLGMNHPAQAFETLRQAQSLYPDDIRAAADLGYAYAMLDQIDEGLELLDRACETSPNDPWALTLLAQVLLMIGHFQGAEHLYRWLHHVHRGSGTSWFGLGWAMQHLDPPPLEEAQKAYRKALKFSPGNPWVRKGIANVMHLRGQTRAAAKLYSEVLREAERRRTENPDMLGLLGWCAFRLGDYTAASRALSELVSVDVKPGANQFDLALVLFCDRRARRSFALYKSTVELLQERHPHLRRGLLTVALGDFRQALRDHDSLGDAPEAERITELLEGERQKFPAMPDLKTVRRLAQKRQVPRAPQ
jgi:tetratricopeptide (TPR) repeat protein